jgi:gluconolactonase
MAAITNTDAFYELVPKNGKLERLATGFAFTEGPIWNKAEKYLLFSDIPNAVRRRWDPKNGLDPTSWPSNKGNGMTYHPSGDLLVCEHATSLLVRLGKDGTRKILASHYQGTELNSPNDVVVASNGDIYFTDPTYGRMPVFGLERKQALDFQGFYRVPKGGELQRMADDFEQPNGICFSPDESLLYVNDSTRAHIRVFDHKPDGSVTNGRVFFDHIGKGDINEGIPDGMKADAKGNIYVTGPGGVWVISPEAKLLGLIEVPENVGNLNWGGDDWKTLFICASTSLYKLDMLVGGSKSPYMA